MATEYRGVVKVRTVRRDSALVPTLVCERIGGIGS